ncbi:hypothetical protein BFF78_10075 [Streptomyces fodineus]|uniref:DUF4232 domain-containing protein n=1 Tax=Streptomyces fodineus TaxID=1904616 RepID=A0A1D7Y6W6_9ACTN|nr:DUF4232 domain-containing protein [Streptomyces fodineus]AOR31335.1 hypothetical protein BFF78_10075 [Streptomyces fodineus]
MRATRRLTGVLAMVTAGMVTAGLALTACGTTTTTTRARATPDASAPPCRTAALTWSLVLLGGSENGGLRPNARMTAINKGSKTCVFDGYPGVEIHNGKAESIDGSGLGHPAPLPLPGKAAVTVDLRYVPRDPKGTNTWCVRQSEAVVWAPHDSDRVVVPVTDAHRKSVTLDACGQIIAMEPPRRASTGS